MSMFLDSSRTLPDTKEGLGNPDMSGILLDSPTLLLSWRTGIPYSHQGMPVEDRLHDLEEPGASGGP
jgi:hypothetical protein